MSALDALMRRALPEPNTGCWLWTGATKENGYGVIVVDGRRFYAHRLSHELHVGVIPPDLDVDHLCRVRCCVNPRHLEAVTRRTNLLRGQGPSAAHARATECPRGHAYTTENTYVGKVRQRRKCRACNRERWHKPVAK